MSDDFKKDLEIDQFSLDSEWRDQPLRYAEWAEKAVDASFQYDKAKERLDVARADLDQKIRKEPAKYGIEKFTEGAVSAAIANNKDFQKQNEEVLEAKRNKMLLDIAPIAFEHRKRALEKLTDLFLSKYYAEPYVSNNAKTVVEKQSETGAHNALKESMNKRKLLRHKE
jgi:hypothetical protein